MARSMTQREKALLQRTNPAIARYLEETDSADWSARLSALRKATTILRAEREALQELAAVGLLREGVGDMVALRGKLDANILRLEALGSENDTLKRRLRQATALPAMAEYAE